MVLEIDHDYIFVIKVKNTTNIFDINTEEVKNLLKKYNRNIMIVEKGTNRVIFIDDENDKEEFLKTIK